MFVNKRKYDNLLQQFNYFKTIAEQKQNENSELIRQIKSLEQKYFTKSQKENEGYAKRVAALQAELSDVYSKYHQLQAELQKQPSADGTSSHRDTGKNCNIVFDAAALDQCIQAYDSKALDLGNYTIIQAKAEIYRLQNAQQQQIPCSLQSETFSTLNELSAILQSYELSDLEAFSKNLLQAKRTTEVKQKKLSERQHNTDKWLSINEERAAACKKRLDLFVLLQDDDSKTVFDSKSIIDHLSINQIISLDIWSKYSKPVIDTSSVYYQKLLECYEQFGQKCFSPKIAQAIAKLLKEKGIIQKSEDEVLQDLHSCFDMM